MQTSGRDVTIGFFVFVAGMASQAIWLFFVPFSWGWDSTANLAIGRMYFGLPFEMWNIKFYYPPAYPVFLTLMGVHHLDTLTFLRIGTWFVGGLMPLFLYLMMRPFNRNAALVAALLLAATFANALFSTDMMNHHFHAFQLLFMSVIVAYHLERPSDATGALLGVAAALAHAGRQVTSFVFFAAVVTLSLADLIEQRNVLRTIRNAIVMLVSFIAAIGILSVARQAALGGPFQFGLTYDNGARVIFQGTYYGASIYQKEFHPGEDFVFVRPENGPASKAYFERVRAYFENVNVKDLRLSESNDKDEAVKNFIADPTVRNTYTMWWGLDSQMSPADGDRLLRNVVIETVFAQPRILRYYINNFWTFLFGPPTVMVDTCVKCTCPPCYGAAMPQSYLGGFMGAEIFSKVAGPRLIAQMATEHERAFRFDRYASYLYADTSQLFVVKPLLTILLLASVFLARGKTRFLMLYCVLAVCIIGGTTSLAWPVQGRYEYPAIPYVLAGAMVAIFEIAQRVREFARIGMIRSRPAG
jgi:hypothetical protein